MPLCREDHEGILSDYPHSQVLTAASAMYLTQSAAKGDLCTAGTVCVIESHDMIYIVMCTNGEVETICCVEEYLFNQTDELTLEFSSWKERKMRLCFEDEEECAQLVNSLPPGLVKRNDKTFSSVNSLNKSLHRWIPWKSKRLQLNMSRKKSQTTQELKHSKPKHPPISTTPKGYATVTRNIQQQNATSSPTPSPVPPFSPVCLRGINVPEDWHLMISRQCPICQRWYPHSEIFQHAETCCEDRIPAARPTSVEHT